MKTIIFSLLLASIVSAESFESYLKRFDYNERTEMKIKSLEAVELYKMGEVEFVDIRFREEQAVWSFPFMKKIPLNELPDRLNELDKNKTIVTVCPHYDRAEMARIYLTLKGYKSRYLNDGLLGLAGYLRGDEAKEFIEETSKK
ncbi:MAG: sulfurtransferase [Sulfuricurvum sp. GWF2_44_89]|uniref:Sulfurtransferase n=1 Tax=Sulfuricurvum kujiense TaxID=148813 RepID=A0A2D3WML7_9BACT|nr:MULTISPECIES: rhodanese-like domain-containing protein [Sulfuricurvum]OHD78852.1 MAG: sulfurtransferase [Sulfuricurvum sp. GWF2_44_89]OHD92679.1 MAG: sulfurtransferase [Sulfuricurvum sp. RIFOXYD12_FULL_44_77]OHD96041.1 MAG: sulfurtransferase [Sulfuricurvum sp. RIFOXYD2_FULL_44_160]DAB38934.1 MAG TPA: sulfurtransferase [Sulfuricurvum kujiense]